MSEGVSGLNEEIIRALYKRIAVLEEFIDRVYAECNDDIAAGRVSGDLCIWSLRTEARDILRPLSKPATEGGDDE